ncbi:cytochrome ubiquinol oxidase subunit I [bacterium]|nr:cytochrome ubiquinol oxidase subunit I [bacterium]
MEVVFLSRLQFAIATCFHFLFVPLTLGLSFLLAYWETKYVRTGDKLYLGMTTFWGKLFLINFALGVVTGITLEFQFGTNWSRYSAYVGDIFGPLLAIEATVAFFLESTLLGVWIFGWNKLSKGMHATIMWLIACASTVSAFWILVANAWMQHPVGYVLRNERAELFDFWTVISQPFALLEFAHTVSASYVLSAFFVLSISAYHLLRRQQLEFFTRSFRTALVLGLVSTLFVVIEGHHHGYDLSRHQPTKLAAMEAHWQTTGQAPLYLFSWPSQAQGRNIFEFGRLPGLLSLMAYHNPKAEVKGLRDFPREEWPPVIIVYLSFRIMVGLGMYFAGLMVLLWFKRRSIEEYPLLLRLVLYSLPLPYLAIELGWIVAEVGRQPWIVYGLMKTSAAASPLASPHVLLTLIGFVIVYGFLGGTAFWLMAHFARKGPMLKT